MGTLKLYWLGPPRAELGGRVIKLETRKATALLAYVSLSPGSCRREFLATLLWPEGNQQTAHASLRRTLSSLRARLPGWIESDRESIALKRSDRLWIDVEAFRQSLSESRHGAGSGTELSNANVSALAEATAQFRGEFLEGLNLDDCPAFDEWQFFQRDELRCELAGALERLCRAYAAGDKSDQAVETALRWVDLDPLHEPAHRMLMDCYVRSGNRSAALRQYAQVQRLLREQQQRDPEQQTRLLYEEIRGPQVEPATGIAPAYPASGPILKTKLYVPTAPASRVERAALLKRLQRVRDYRLTLISAPAGFGKTTLMAEWIANTPVAVAWLSLDHGDNDPYRFLAYLIEALQSIQEGVGADARQLMHSSQPGPPHIILASLINDLGKTATSGVLVLDDYQYISEYAVHDSVSYLLDHIPSNFHIVITSRADPPLRLGRLRAHAQLLELRTQDLRFSAAEAAEFLNGVMALHLSASDIQVLEARTEGWVVGLQLAALSLKDQERAADFIRDFSGSNRFILDYLVEEVLKRQPARIQAFLLQTSILDRLNGSLCNAVMAGEWFESGEGSQAVLEYLERSNLFVVPLDDSGQWYRYHHLFADLLRSRLAQSPSPQLMSSHGRASSWFERNGYPVEAIEHALDAHDLEAAIRLIENYAGDWIFSGHYATALEWIRRLPPERLQAHPWISVWQAWGVLASGRIDGVEELIRQARSALAGMRPEQPEPFQHGTDRLSDLILALEMTLASMQERHSETVDLGRQLLSRLPDPSSRHRANALYTMGNAYYATGELTQAAQAYQEVRRVSLDTGFLLRHILATHKLACIKRIKANLRESYELSEGLISKLAPSGQQDFFGMGFIYSDMATVVYEWDHLEQARSLLARSLQLGEATGVPMIMVDGYCSAMPLLIGMGDVETAAELQAKAADLMETYPVLPETRDLFECCKLRLWLATNDAERVAEWSQLRRRPGTPRFETELGDIAFARALMARGELDPARALLGNLAKGAEAGGRQGRLIQILLLRALLLRLQDRQESALEFLKRGLELGEAGNYLRTYIDQGQWLYELLTTGLEQGCFDASASRVYISDVWKGFGREPRAGVTGALA